MIQSAAGYRIREQSAQLRQGKLLVLKAQPRSLPELRGKTPDVKFEITDVQLNGASVDFDKDAAVMSEDAATKSDDYSDWEFDIKNTARVQLINVYDNIAAIPNDSYTSISVTFNVTGLGGGAAADDTAADATETGSDAVATPDKGSPDTGVEGVAAVAGLAVVAAGAVVMSRKRK